MRYRQDVICGLGVDMQTMAADKVMSVTNGHELFDPHIAHRPRFVQNINGHVLIYYNDVQIVKLADFAVFRMVNLTCYWMY